MKRNKMSGLWNKSLLRKSFIEISKNRKDALYTLFFDILFIISILLFSNIVRFFALNYRQNIQALFTSPYIGTALAVIFILAYLSAITAIYSFFKLMVLRRFCIMHKKHSSSRFLPFFRLNLMILGISAAVLYFLTHTFSYFFNRPFSSYIISAFLMIFVFFYYPFISLSHFSYMENRPIRKSMKQAYDIVFCSLKSYLPLYGWSVLFLLLFTAIYYFISILARQWIAHSLGAYYQVSGAIAFILLYIMVWFNRFYFYEIHKSLLK